ncbi:MAG: low specificity L-threonine aldolase [Lachnospiraceae bacterium]|nr:low specificity L-threonine aldolase [Lachnospiraceae bacterium]
MIRFECDYAEGAHEKILKLLFETNFEQTPGYGSDEYCDKAREIIKKLCGCPEADVHFFVGGTQTNATVIASVLRPYQGVICAESGHINVHETGAIEMCGHKILSLPSKNGKITAAQVKEAYEAHMDDSGREHMVQPGMVYISNPTEVGTLYKKSELESLSKVCKERSLPLYIDGARMGYGIAAEGNDLFIPDMARLCDIFYIGGTKIGALFGEALVITNPALKNDFRYLIKQHGAMLAKGRILGIQFIALLEDDTYFEISKKADLLAMQMRRGFEENGYPMLFDSPTNQQFPILPDSLIKKLEEKYTFSFWEKTDETHSAVRFCTSWATKKEAVDALIEDIKKLSA